MKCFGFWPLAGKKETVPVDRDGSGGKRMESQLLNRIYTGPAHRSSQVRRLRAGQSLPLGYELAYGAFCRKTCGIAVPGDFAVGLSYSAGMTFAGFVAINRIELMDDQADGMAVAR